MAVKLTIGTPNALTLTIGTPDALAVKIKNASISTIQGEEYTGETTVTPRAFQEQVLPTRDKVVRSDITVKEVPYFEVDAPVGGGKTVYIARRVD